MPTPLRSYTHGAATVEGGGATLAELLVALDRDYPGIRFRMIDEQDRIRPHIKLFTGLELADSLHVDIKEVEEVHIICALSGGTGRKHFPSHPL